MFAKNSAVSLLAAFAAVPALALGSSETHQSNDWVRWQPAFNAVVATAKTNLHPANSWMPIQHVEPAPLFHGVYLWDSAFVALVWLNIDTKVARDIILSVLTMQRPDGRIPHMRNADTVSEWTQPPVLAWAALQVAQKTSDRDFAAKVLPDLLRYHRWLVSNRQLATGGFFWRHPYESGVDNSPRFGKRDESFYFDTTHLAAVDLTSFMVIDAEAIRDLAIWLGSKSASSLAASSSSSDVGAEIQTEMQSKINKYNKFIQTALWNDQAGYFFDRVEPGEPGEPRAQTSNVALSARVVPSAPVASIASLMPLFSGSATQEQAAKLIAHIRDPLGFNTLIPFPTVARGDAAFEKDCWRGPVWVNTAYMAIEGLRRYGANDLANEMSRRLVDGVYGAWQKTGQFVEFYDPDRYDFEELSRKKGTGLWGLSGSSNPIVILRHLVLKQILLGRKPVAGFIGWTGLVNNLALRVSPPKPVQETKADQSHARAERGSQ